MEEPAAAVRLQCAARGWRARRDARSLILENARLAAEDVRVLSASMVQRAWRRHRAARAAVADACSTRGDSPGATRTESGCLVTALDHTLRGTDAFLTCGTSFTASDAGSSGSSTPSLADAEAGALARDRTAAVEDPVAAASLLLSTSQPQQRPSNSVSAAPPRARWVWDLSEVDWSRYAKDGGGDCLHSPPFSCGGVSGLSLQLYPHGDEEATNGYMSLYLKGPAGVLVQAALSVDGEREVFDGAVAIADGYGFVEFAPRRTCYWAVVVELLLLRHGFHWDLAGQDMAALPRGDSVESPIFSCFGVADLWLSFFPHGSSRASKGFASIYLRGPPGVAMRFSLTVVTSSLSVVTSRAADTAAVDEETSVTHTTETCRSLNCADESDSVGTHSMGGCWGAGWHDAVPVSARYVRVELEVTQVQTDETHSWRASVDGPGTKLESAPFSCMGLKGLQLSLYPSASSQPSSNDVATRESTRQRVSGATDIITRERASGAHGPRASSQRSSVSKTHQSLSVFLRGPPGVLVDFSIAVDGNWRHLGNARDISTARGWNTFSSSWGSSGLPQGSDKRDVRCRGVNVQVHVHSWRFGFEWTVVDIDWRRYKRGDVVKSAEFACAGLSGLQLLLYPKGCLDSRTGSAGLFLTSTSKHGTPPMLARLNLDESSRTFRAPKCLDAPVGWKDFTPMQPTYKQVRVEILELRDNSCAFATLLSRPSSASLHPLWAELSRITLSSSSHTCHSSSGLRVQSLGAGEAERERKQTREEEEREPQSGGDGGQMAARLQELEVEVRELRLRAEVRVWSVYVARIVYCISYIIHHTSYIIHHISYIIYHISYIIYHRSHIAYHTSYITCGTCDMSDAVGFELPPTSKP